MRGVKSRSLLHALRHPSLLTQFAVVSFVLVFAFGAVLSDRVGTSIERATIDSSARMISATTQFILGSGLVSTNPHVSPAEERVVTRMLAATGKGQRILELRALLPNGFVVFATDPSLIGKTVADPAMLSQSLHSGTAARVVTPGNLDVHTAAFRSLVRQNGSLLQVYLDVRLANPLFPRVVLVYSMPYAPLAATIAQKERSLLWLVVGGLAVLYLVLFRLVAAASRRILRQAEENRRLALHDVLTGLPNRTLLADRIERASAHVARHGGVAAVLLLDLDRFKEVNDTLGHDYGDLLLIEVARRLESTLRAEDTAARLGGDEFAVLAPQLADEEEAEALGRRLLAALHEPFYTDGITLDVEASIGIALAPADGLDNATLLRCADVAMYTAKEEKLGVARYQLSADHNTPARLALLGDLRRALESTDQLILHYQPKVHLRTGRLAGVEALLRWQHPEQGLVSPGAFIPAAESTALIHPLTTYVMETALRQMRRWLTAGHEVEVAVNVSTRCLLDAELPSKVAELLERHEVPAHLLRIEITEEMLMPDPAGAHTVLSGLHSLGVRISVDDFGTGYSSMNYLKELPVDELKVDRSFVLDMQGQDSNSILVRSVVELGHNLGMSVVAEGVEESATLTALVGLGCDVAQGFHLARPMPPEELTEQLASGRRYLVAAPAATSA